MAAGTQGGAPLRLSRSLTPEGPTSVVWPGPLPRDGEPLVGTLAAMSNKPLLCVLVLPTPHLGLRCEGEITLRGYWWLTVRDKVAHLRPSC